MYFLSEEFEKEKTFFKKAVFIMYSSEGAISKMYFLWEKFLKCNLSGSSFENAFLEGAILKIISCRKNF